jgi:hypothetical protein
MPTALNYISIKDINAYSVKVNLGKIIMPRALNYISVKGINAYSIELY